MTWREDVYHRRTGDCLWHRGECCVWVNLLDMDTIIKNGCASSAQPFLNCHGAVSSIISVGSSTLQMLNAYFLPFLLLSHK